MEEEDLDGEEDADADVQDLDAGAAGFVNYIQHEGSESNTNPDPKFSPAPQRDTLNNQYVRVVHMNGVHHIAMVCCTCRGKESIINDVIYAGMLPTSFVQI
jgi:hypothetical protein